MFVPIILLFLGVGDLSKIVIIFLILFFQILVLVRDEAAALRSELIASVYSLGAGRRALFRFVYLPASIPAILTALRQSVGTAVAVLYITELFATHPTGPGLLHLPSGQHPVPIPENVCRGDRHEPVGPGTILRGRLDRASACALEVCELNRWQNLRPPY